MESPTPQMLNPEQLALIQKKLKLQNGMRNGVNWFFWIAGLSIINSILYFFGSSISFVIGLGATQFVDGIVTGIVKRYSSGGFTVFHVIGFIIDLFIAGIFILFGYLGKKRFRWAIITGMILYTLDAILFIWVGAWLSVAFHGLGLWGLWQGFKSLNGLVALEKTTPVTIEGFVKVASPDRVKPNSKERLLVIIFVISIILLLLGILITNLPK